MEDALKRNVQEVEVKMAEMAGQGRRESIYLGDVGECAFFLGWGGGRWDGVF